MANTPPPMRRPVPVAEGDALDLSYYTPATVSATHRTTVAGKYQVVFDVRAVEKYVDNQFDLNRCKVTFSLDGESVLAQDFVREGSKRFEFPFDRTWTPGEHELKVEIAPVSPDRPQIRNLRLRLNAVVVRGPFAEEHWVKPKDYAKFFPKDPPADAAGRRSYARELLAPFATRAFRRPAQELCL